MLAVFSYMDSKFSEDMVKTLGYLKNVINGKKTFFSYKLSSKGETNTS